MKTAQENVAGEKKNKPNQNERSVAYIIFCHRHANYVNNHECVWDRESSKKKKADGPRGM